MNKTPVVTVPDEKDRRTVLITTREIVHLGSMHPDDEDDSREEDD